MYIPAAMHMGALADKVEYKFDPQTYAKTLMVRSRVWVCILLLPVTTLCAGRSAYRRRTSAGCGKPARAEKRHLHLSVCARDSLILNLNQFAKPGRRQVCHCFASNEKRRHASREGSSIASTAGCPLPPCCSPCYSPTLKTQQLQLGHAYGDSGTKLVATPRGC